MRVDFLAPILTLEGTPVVREPAKTIVSDSGQKTEVPAEPLLLKHVAVEALMCELDDDGPKVSADERLARLTLSARINGATAPLDLKSEQVVKLKDRITRGAPAFTTAATLIVGRSLALLEPPEDAVATLPAPSAGPALVPDTPTGEG